MIYIAENLKALRKANNYTQEEVADMLCVSAQSVSKWERSETMPDITLLPALANLYRVSVDAILGMDKINDNRAKGEIFSEAHSHLRAGEIGAAISVYTEAQKAYPGDAGILSDLAVALALDGDIDNIRRAVALCERILSGGQSEKVHHTTRAALCFIHMKAGDNEKAVSVAKNLPHVRESRESILERLTKQPSLAEIDACLTTIAIGES